MIYIFIKGIHLLSEYLGDVVKKMNGRHKKCRTKQFEDELRRLTPYAVKFRYDDEPMPLVSPEQSIAYTSRVLA